jgi:serine phosphatase RsbU (regulator of sigma subunit)
MAGAATLSAHEAMNHMLWERRKFAELQRGHDDTTLVVVKVS